MSRYFTDVAQATATVGYNCFSGKRWSKEAYPRTLTRVGFTGSAVIGDCDADLRVGGVIVSQITNSKLGMGSDQDDMLPVNQIIPANVELELIVTTQPTTNPICVVLEFAP